MPRIPVFPLPCILCLLLLALFAPRPAWSASSLSVIQFLPQGEVAELSRVVVRFSEPIRPLGSMEQPAASSPLRLTATGGELPPGEFRWLDPSTLAYLFAAPVEHPLLLEAAIPSGLAALSGNTLDKETRWSLSTRPLALSLPDPETPLPRTGAHITFYSNYPLDEERLPHTLRLCAAPDGPDIPLKRIEGPAQGQWPPAYFAPTAKDGSRLWAYTAHVDGEIPKNSRPRLEFARGTAFRDGATTETSQALSLRGYSDLQVIGLEVQGSDTTNIPVYAPLRVTLSNPVQFKDLLTHLSVTADGGKAEALPDEIVGDDKQDSFFLPFRWKPRTRYTVTLRPGLTDSNGTTLQQGKSLTFSTGDIPAFFSAPQGTGVLEQALNGLVPLRSINTGPVAVRLSYIPWESGGYAALLPALPGSARDMEKADSFFARAGTLPGGKERSLAVDDSATPNEEVTTLLNLPELLGLAGPGNAALRGPVRIEARIPDRGAPGKKTYSTRVSYLHAARHGLNLKIGREDGLAWVTDLEAGTPVAGVEVRIRDAEGNERWQGKTDASGLALTPGRDRFPDNAFFLTAGSGSDLSVLPFASASMGSQYGRHLGGPEEQPVWRGHLLSQLPVYKQGEEVRFTVFARIFTDTAAPGGERIAGGDWLPLAGKALRLELRDPRGKVVHSQEAVSNAYGTIAGSCVLAENAALGDYTFTLADAKGALQTLGQAFPVAAFRPPDFKVDLTVPASRPALLEGETPLEAPVRAAYFSGAAVQGAEASLTLSGRETVFTPGRLEGYVTGLTGPISLRHDFRPGQVEKREFPDLRTTLDAAGSGRFLLPEIRVEAGKPLQLDLEATVTDAAGLATQGVGDVLLHPASVYVGLKARRFVTQNESFILQYKAAGCDDAAVGAGEIRLAAERVVWNRNADDPGESFEPLWERKLVIDSEAGGTLSLSFAEGGSYALTARITDAEGRENASRVRVFVAGGEGVWGVSSRAGLFLEADAPSYRPGDTARIVIGNPFAEAHALVTTERDGILTSRVFPVSGPSPAVDLPIGPGDAPYVFASVTLVRGRLPDSGPLPPSSGPSGPSGEDHTVPKARRGTLLLPVEASVPTLRVAVSTNERSYRTGGTVQTAVRVSDSDGLPRQAQVTLLAVDDRILRAAGEKHSHDPAAVFTRLYSHEVTEKDNRNLLYNFFLSKDGLDFKTKGRWTFAFGEMNDMAVPMAAAGDAFMARQRVSAPAMLSATGGDAAVRGNFATAVFWLAEGETDAQGLLEAAFSLPDSLTSYRIVAVASDKLGRFAKDETSVTASKPLQLLSALPRFLTEGDSLEARILVQNMTDLPGTVSVRASSRECELRRDAVTLPLAPGGSATAVFPLQAPTQGSASLLIEGVMHSDAGAERDALLVSLPVLPALPLTTVAASGLLREGETQRLPIGVAARPGQTALDPRSRLEVALAASPAAGMPLTAKQVLEYPWDCAEQRLSRAFVRILRLRHGAMLGMPADARDRDVVRRTLEDMADFQGYDGGLSLWPGASESNLFVTAYALLVDREAQALDLGMEEERRHDAVRFLDQDLRNAYGDIADSPAPADSRRRVAFSLGRPEQAARSLTGDALALWILAGHDPEQAARFFPRVLEQALDRMDAASPAAWAGLLLAAREMPDLPEREAHMTRIMEILEKGAAISAAQLHFTAGTETRFWLSLGSLLRDNAVVLAALSEVRPDYPRLDALAAWVARGLGDRANISTQEGAMGVWGLAAYLHRIAGTEGSGIEAVWNGKERLRASFARPTDPPAAFTLPADRLDAADQAVLALTAEKGSPSWTARLTYAVRGQTPAPAVAGFTLQRSMTPAGPVRHGDVVDMEIRLTVPENRRHVLVFAPFPAGLEPLHASRADLAGRDQPYSPPWQWSEQHDDGLLLYAPAMEPGVYTYVFKLRAASPGTFVQRPAYAEEMYTPEVFGRTAAGVVEVQ